MSGRSPRHGAEGGSAFPFPVAIFWSGPSAPRSPSRPWRCCNRAGAARPPVPRAGSAELGALEPELNIYNWSDYIGPEVIPGFEKEFGVQVTYDTFESSEEMVAKLQAGATGYDLVVPTTYAVTVLLESGLLAPLSQKYLTNIGNIAPVFRGLGHDPQNKYAVPWQWGMTGIAWRKDLVSAVPESWSVFLGQEPRGKMTMLDDVRDVIGVFLRLRGHSINSTDPGELEAARKDAIAAKKNLKAYLSAPVKAQLIAGMSGWRSSGTAMRPRPAAISPRWSGCFRAREAPCGSIRWWCRPPPRIRAPRTNSSTTSSAPMWAPRSRAPPGTARPIRRRCRCCPGRGAVSFRKRARPARDPEGSWPGERVMGRNLDPDQVGLRLVVS